MTTESSPWFPYRPSLEAPIRLFCFPYAGGGASAYRSWAEAMPPAVEVWPIQLPGREARHAEATYTQCLPLAEAIAEALHAYLDKPFVFFGHSMGALLCFEVTRQLRKRRRPQPSVLVVS